MIRGRPGSRGRVAQRVASLPCLAFALLLGPATIAAQVVPPEVSVVTLKNGLRVLLAPDSLAAGVDVAVWYRAGTRFEPPGMSGITHLIERWMFRGTKNFGPGQHRRLVQEHGGTAGTFTTSDASCFYETVPAEALELALRLEADRMGALQMTTAELERVRRIAGEENQQLERSGPIRVGLQKLYATAFAGHPYAWPATGLAQDLGRVTLVACQAYLRARYAPGNAVLVLTGRFDPAMALGLVRRHFGPIAPAPAVAAKPLELPQKDAERRASDRVQSDIRILLVGWRGPGGADPSAVPLDLVARLLATGPRSRLGAALMTPPLMPCLGVEGGFDARRDGSLLYVTAAVRSGVDSADVERALLAEAERLAATPPPSEELDAAKREVELAMMREWQTVRGRGQVIGEAEAVLGDHRLAAQRLQRLRELTPDDVMRAAAVVLEPGRRSVVWLIPGRGAGGGGRGATR